MSIVASTIVNSILGAPVSQVLLTAFAESIVPPFLGRLPNSNDQAHCHAKLSRCSPTTNARTQWPVIRN